MNEVAFSKCILTPNAGIVKARVMIGHGQQGHVVPSLVLYGSLKDGSIVDTGFIEEACKSCSGGFGYFHGLVERVVGQVVQKTNVTNVGVLRKDYSCFFFGLGEMNKQQ